MYKKQFTCGMALSVCLVMSLGGCGQSAKWPAQTTKSASATTTPQPAQAFSEKYNDYLLLMEESQRARFFRIEIAAERDRFIESEGIQQKKYLNDHLSVGMNPTKVEEVLGHPLASETVMESKGKTTNWVYSMFNGYRNVRYMVVFANDRVSEWRLWLP